MTFGAALFLGLAMGLRHATDADHVAAIGTLLHREASPYRAARLAALWGFGHTLTFLTLGLLVVIAGFRLSPAFERVADVAVAAMLVALGSFTIVRARRHVGTTSLRWRPVIVGVVHGLAGSAAVALLALTTIASRSGALLYLALFCGGTVVGMMMLTVVLAFPLGWSQRKYGEVPRTLIVVASLASIAIGLTIGIRALV